MVEKAKGSSLMQMVEHTVASRSVNWRQSGLSQIVTGQQVADMPSWKHSKGYLLTGPVLPVHIDDRVLTEPAQAGPRGRRLVWSRLQSHWEDASGTAGQAPVSGPLEIAGSNPADPIFSCCIVLTLPENV